MIAERSAEQEQRRQREQIGVDDPLHVRCPRAIARADRGQRNAQHGTVDEREARGENAGGQRPPRADAGFIPPAAVAWAQSTFCAMAASTMFRHIAASPTAAIASSGSRAV